MRDWADTMEHSRIIHEYIHEIEQSDIETVLGNRPADKSPEGDSKLLPNEYSQPWPLVGTVLDKLFS
jgi:hypothetical protein